MARSPIIMDDAPLGTERSYSGVRLAGALSKREGFEGHSRPVAAMMELRTDFTRREVVLPGGEAWRPSLTAGAER